MLPDDVLLEIFDFYRLIPIYTPLYPGLSWPWHLLVHVCRRWRQIIFESPNRLDLHILCTHKTPVKKNLRIWPNFPLFINYDDYTGPSLIGNVIDALRLSNRVGQVKLKKLCSSSVPLRRPLWPSRTHGLRLHRRRL
jgi:hypothetical protein